MMVAPRQVELEAHLDDLLIRWANLGWGRIDVAKRLPSASPSCVGFMASRQWDASELDDEDEARAVLALLDAVSALPSQQQLAVTMHARALMTGVAVWSSPRLPADPRARQVLVEAGRAALVARLIACGVLGA